MASLYWVGGESGSENNFGVKENWRNTSDNSVASAAPTDNDILYFDHRAAADCTAGMNQTGVDLRALYVTAGWRRNLGLSSDPLVIGVSNVTTSAAEAIFSPSAGSIYVSAGDTPFDLLSIEAVGSAVIRLTGGTFTRVFGGGNGTVSVGSSATVTTLEAAGTQFIVAGGGSGSAITTAYVTGNGALDVDRTVTTANLLGGSSFFRHNSVATTMNLSNGNHRYHGASVTTWNARGGSLDLNGIGKDVTLGSSTGTWYREAAKVTEYVPGVTVTIGSSVAKLGKTPMM